MALRVALVLRSGGEYRPEHVRALVAQLERHLPGVGVVCLSDVDVPCARVPLQHGWPGWWSKMELFRPDLSGDILYFDLDTVIVGDLSEFKVLSAPTMLSDFYWPERPASGVMFLPESCRRKVWNRWIESPDRHMVACGRLGDQKFIGDALGPVRRFQNVLPGRIVSYKAHVQRKGAHRRATGNGTVPAGASVVCFHGRPRPWGIREDWVPDYAIRR